MWFHYGCTYTNTLPMYASVCGGWFVQLYRVYKAFAQKHPNIHIFRRSHRPAYIGCLISIVHTFSHFHTLGILPKREQHNTRAHTHTHHWYLVSSNEVIKSEWKCQEDFPKSFHFCPLSPVIKIVTSQMDNRMSLLVIILLTVVQIFIEFYDSAPNYLEMDAVPAYVIWNALKIWPNQSDAFSFTLVRDWIPIYLPKKQSVSAQSANLGGQIRDGGQVKVTEAELFCSADILQSGRFQMWWTHSNDFSWDKIAFDDYCADSGLTVCCCWCRR